MSSATAPQDDFSAKFDSVTHQIFPARTKLKDLAYWVSEIFAAVYLLILILQMGLTESPEMKTSGGDSFTVSTLTDKKNNLINCEFGWIALIYTLKYLVYIVDTVLMMQKKYSTGVDLVPVALNFIVWLIWTLYGFFAKEEQVLSGYGYRAAKDALSYSLDKGVITQQMYDAQLNAQLDAYNNNQTGTWIWIPCLIAFGANLACWIMGLAQKRSTLFTNASISAWAIPLQLFCLNLAMKGSWFKSSYKTNAEAKAEWSNNLPPSASAFRSQGELFDARYIFIIIYFASWLLLLGAVPTIMRGVKEFKNNTLNGVKYVLYGLFFISNFFWCLFMDAVLMETYIAHKGWLILFSIISIVLALAIGIISLKQKFSEDESEYFSRHGQTPVVKPQ